MQVPSVLVDSVRSGAAVLFLGAGASRGAAVAIGDPPLGLALRDLIADKFLGGQFKDENLAYVCELAISETELITVQEFIASIFAGIKPATFHELIPTFPWRAIITTNFDRLIETVYGANPNRAQDLTIFVSNRDPIDEKLRGPNAVPLVKLHGCITRVRDPEVPLILTTEQYISHKSNRGRLFQTFENWAYERPVVFIGHELRDHDLRTIILQLSNALEVRPRYYLVKPNVSAEEVRFWEGKKITVLDGTFSDFLSALNHAIPPNIRPLLQHTDGEHPVKRHFTVDEPIGATLIEFLEQDMELVHAGMPIENGTANAFYRGFDLGWFPIDKNLDVRRTLTDVLLHDVVIRPEIARPTIVELYAVKAEAGAGKTVFLRRLAWESATDGDQFCLYLRRYGEIRYDALRELHRVTGKRLFVFVDHAADHVLEIAEVIRQARRDAVPITIITAERTNTWNTDCDALDQLVTEVFTLRYLSHTEIEVLVGLLEKHDCLGPSLIEKNFVGRVAQFEKQAGRQLLVALHEATLGKPFEEILLDEYSEIRPRRAQLLYLTVCVLNRLGVPVRAGVIARVHQIPFEEFKTELFAPLDHVVQVKLNVSTQDFLYSARHPEIAQIVFERVLKTVTDRFNEYTRILRELNLSYSTDRTAFRGLIRAKSVIELFPNHQDAKAIYDQAEKVAPNEAYVFQQRANYERLRPDGNYNEAQALLHKAAALDPRDTSITHTLAEVLRTQAQSLTRPLERERMRLEAKHLLTKIVNDRFGGKYARHTLVKLALDDLIDTFADEEATDRQIDESIRKVEEQLARWLQDDPNDVYLLTAEADFAKLLRDDRRSLVALEGAFKTNPRDPFVAARLAKAYEARGEPDRAESMLEVALAANRGDRQINFRYAMLLRELGRDDPATMIYHLRRAFVPGDHNHEAQFWFARYAFQSKDDVERNEAKDTFRRLRLVPMEHRARMEVRDAIMSNKKRQSFSGTVSRLEITFGFIQRDGEGDEIFFHRNNVEDTLWETLRPRSRVTFCVGFNYSGPTAVDVILGAP